MKAAMKTGWCL